VLTPAEKKKKNDSDILIRNVHSAAAAAAAAKCIIVHNVISFIICTKHIILCVIINDFHRPSVVVGPFVRAAENVFFFSTYCYHPAAASSVHHPA